MVYSKTTEESAISDVIPTLFCCCCCCLFVYVFVCCRCLFVVLFCFVVVYYYIQRAHISDLFLAFFLVFLYIRVVCPRIVKRNADFNGTVQNECKL